MLPGQAPDPLPLRLFDLLPLWAVYALTVLLFLLASEGGYRLGLIERRRAPEGPAVVGALNGATLALLGFLLAFVTGGAVTSLQARRQAVVEEANAIGTAYLRAGYLPAPNGPESRRLYAEYVDTRLEGLDPNKLGAAIARSEALHAQLWARAEAVARDAPSPTTALYVAAVNDVIDRHTDRLNAALVARLSPTIILGLYLMALLALGLVGLHAAAAGQRSPVAVLALALTLAVVFLLIADMRRGQEGYIQVSQQALIDLQRQLRAAP
jgi:hypothetical protein